VAEADPRLVKIVLENLFNNAWKYSRNNNFTRIFFGSRVIDDQTTYYLKDNGAGFDMKYADKLFIAFQRLHSEAEFEGNGIGLATVKRVILKHRGKVWAEGEIDQGATFYFTL
jgi:light-regulated signal transduction histidine kinase (bacteriophytochrome)